KGAGRLICAAAALAAGAALAAVQWLPTYELTRLSEREHGVDLEFFTSFSLHPAHFATMLWPFLRGNPYPLTSLETIGYAGALPVMLAVVAPLRRRDRLVLFWGCTSAVAVLLSLGRWNPAYKWLGYVPVLNYFRAPARYLLWLDVGIAVLAAAAMESLLRRTRGPGAQRAVGAAAAVLVALGTGAWWVSRVPLERLIAAWRVLPLVWLLAGMLLLAFLRLRPARALWASAAVGLVVIDLFAFNGVYNQTYNAVMPRAELERPPEVLAFLREDAGPGPFRVYTSEEIVPVLPVMRESLYPNIQLLHGVESLNGYYPLLPGPQRWLLGNMNARLADLLGVRYVLVPQLLPVDEASEAYDTRDPLAPPLADRTFDIQPVRVLAVEVEGYLSHSADLADGTPVGDVVLRAGDGTEAVWTLRAGHELAEWAYLRDDVQEAIRHRLAEGVVRRWPARSGFPAREHEGLTFLARHDLDGPIEVARIEVRSRVPAAFLHLERLRLIGPGGSTWLLSELVGQGDHVLVYRSEDVAVFRNERAGPRAFLVHRARVARDEAEAQRLVLDGSFSPHEEVILLGGTELQGASAPGDDVTVEVYRPELVRVRVRTAAEAYLVLADSYYPGWKARVDGREVALLRADVALRAVRVPAGEHVIEFTYDPLSWRLGLAVSLVAGAALVAVATTRLRKVVVHP
ncbi:MAG: YfhO family protein, partial [Anaerolineae bacterium]|nr:YfhO family protein [Anaerolineae bacterium]